jgi:hypothetical protein
MDGVIRQLFCRRKSLSLHFSVIEKDYKICKSDRDRELVQAVQLSGNF